jgi:cytosine deaminase
MTALLERMVASGTSHVRTHTDVVTDHGLAGVEAVWAARERLGGRVTIEQVAFPQYGVLADPGTAELLDEALSNGVEVIGGIDPAGADRDPVRHLDIVFTLAERHGAGIDIHLHDGGSHLATRADLRKGHGDWTRRPRRGQPRLRPGAADQATQDRLGRQLADAGVSLVTAAVYDFRSRPSPDCAPPESPSPAATTASATCGARGVRLLLDGVISPRIGG